MGVQVGRGAHIGVPEKLGRIRQFLAVGKQLAATQKQIVAMRAEHGMAEGALTWPGSRTSGRPLSCVLAVSLLEVRRMVRQSGRW